MTEKNYKPTIGLEIHVELKTKSKMFCSCANETWKIGQEDLLPNKNVCPVCLAHPGTMPVPNVEAIKSVIKAGLALNCQIAEKSKFDRKQYFYPDLPKGYQISQYDEPLCQNGQVELSGKNIGDDSRAFAGNSHLIRIKRIHLEEDTGKLSHISDGTLVDYNRAGVPLMELVTEPDIESGAEAKEFCQELQVIFRELEIADANMEKGQMRCEVNISLSNEPRIKANVSRMDDKTEIVLKDESYELMGLLFEIHTKLGSIYKEINYQDAIEEVLKREKISYVREKQIILKFNDLELSNLFADFIVDNKILIEVKVKNFITNDDVRQTSRYIKSENLPLGIVVNFKKEKLEYKRVINPAFEKFENNSSSFVANSRSALGTKVEIKNLNSFRAVERAIDYEIKRQTGILEAGEKVVQETRGWDETKGETFSQRVKEGSADYRYFPEPDIPPLKFKTQLTELKDNENFIDVEKIKQELPEMPMKKRQRFMDEYGFALVDAKIITAAPELADYAENVISELHNWLLDSGQFEGTAEEIWNNNREKVAKLVGGWLINKLGGLLAARKLSYVENTITAENFAEFVTMIFTRRVSSTNANKLLERMLETGGDPSSILEDEDLGGGDNLDLNKLVEEIINKNPDTVAQFKNGKTALMKFFIGQIMKESKGKADPVEAENIFLQKLT
jgi:GxxExxY protein